jgi:hypothetical protein
MKLNDIKDAVDSGKTVCYKQHNYTVEKVTGTSLDPLSMQHIPYEEYDIVCSNNEHRIGLTWADGVTLNGEEEDFFIKEEV